MIELGSTLGKGLVLLVTKAESGELTAGVIIGGRGLFRGGHPRSRDERSSAEGDDGRSRAVDDGHASAARHARAGRLLLAARTLVLLFDGRRLIASRRTLG